MAYAASKRKRNSNWTEDETLLLMNLVKQHKKIVRGKFSDGVTSRTKVETWQTITQQINGAFPCVLRTVEQVQKRYHNITSSGKHRIATQKRLFCRRGGGPSGDKPQLNPLSDAVADEDEDTTKTCTFMIPPPQSSQESQPSGSTLIHRSTSVDWGQPITKKVIDLKITELQNSIKFYSAQMEVARAQMEAARAQMELQKTKIELAKVQLQKYHEMREEST